MIIKTLTGSSVQDALVATAKTKTWELRSDIGKLFRQKTAATTLRNKLKALLASCEELSEERNKLLHNAWAIAPDGSVVTKGHTHAWGPVPTVGELNELAAEIHTLVKSLNDARLRGFIRDVCKSDKPEISSGTSSTSTVGSDHA